METIHLDKIFGGTVVKFRNGGVSTVFRKDEEGNLYFGNSYTKPTPYTDAGTYRSSSGTGEHPFDIVGTEFNWSTAEQGMAFKEKVSKNKVWFVAHNKFFNKTVFVSDMFPTNNTVIGMRLTDKANLVRDEVNDMMRMGKEV